MNLFPRSVLTPKNLFDGYNDGKLKARSLNNHILEVTHSDKKDVVMYYSKTTGFPLYLAIAEDFVKLNKSAKVTPTRVLSDEALEDLFEVKK